MKRSLLVISLLLLVAGAAAQTLTPLDRTPIYRRSFTARYDLIGTEPVREAALSPDRTMVGYVRDNDLYIKELATGVETRVTHDGERNRVINGATDWVYEEEYAFTRAWEWSPDSRRVAYLRFDEGRVREFSMMRFEGRLYPEPYLYKYPKAGEENSIVTLHLYDVASGSTRRVDTGAETDQYIPRLGWTPAGELFFYRVNRLQNHFEVVLAEGTGETESAPRMIYDERSPRYVERPDENTVTFLPDGDRFIVRQETRTGWMHLYLHSITKGFLHAITSGEWEVAALKSVEGDVVTYTSTEPSPLARADYSIRLNGKGKKMLSHAASAAPPADGREFFTVPVGGGVELNGWMMCPEGFDPARRYPVLMTQYSGPGSQSVSYGAAGDMSIVSPLLAAGYIVACVDGRGTGFRGEEFKKYTYGELGRLETEDQIAAARHIAALPYVDPARIGIYGWSYGGFISLNSVLKGADVFAAAVAVAPVTSWRYYDTIYTEAYNGLPQDNPRGYDDNSPVNYASLLKGKLLLVHGTGDDNVHVQNSYEMARALVKADRRFDMMVYPDDNHSMWPSGSRHVRAKIVEWVIENL